MGTIPGLSFIAAMTSEQVIGQGGTLPWRVPSDLRRFKQLTTGHPVIMGRKNWESIPQKFRPLPERTNIVLTRQTDYRAEGAVPVYSLEHALETASKARGAEEIFVIGGEEIYCQFFPFVERMYITWVHASVRGDVHFPEYTPSDWHVVEETAVDTWDPKDQYPTSFEILARAVL